MLGMLRRPFSSEAFAPRFPCTQRPPPNQALELTASRRTTSFSMTSTPSPAAARALARSSSAFSR